MQIYQPVRIGKKLVARHVDTKAIAPKSLIRAIQIRNAEANNELLMVSASGRVTMIENNNPQSIMCFNSLFFVFPPEASVFLTRIPESADVTKKVISNTTTSTERKIAMVGLINKFIVLNN